MFWFLSVGAAAAGLAGLTLAAARAAKAGREAGRAGVVVPVLLLAGGAAGAASLWPGTYYVEKSLTRLAVPTGLIWVGLWASAAGLLWRGRWAGGAVVALAAAAFTAAGNPVLANRLALSLQKDHVRDPLAAGVGEFDAVVVLGGGVSLNEHGRPVATAFGQRAVLGAELFHAGRTPVLLAAGTAPPGDACPGPGRVTRDLWANLKVPREKVELLPGTTTSEEMASLSAAVRANGWRRVGLVSSAWHLPRAVRLAGAAGLCGDPSPHHAHHPGHAGRAAGPPAGGGGPAFTQSSPDHPGGADPAPAGPLPAGFELVPLPADAAGPLDSMAPHWIPEGEALATTDRCVKEWLARAVGR